MTFPQPRRREGRAWGSNVFMAASWFAERVCGLEGRWTVHGRTVSRLGCAWEGEAVHEEGRLCMKR